MEVLISDLRQGCSSVLIVEGPPGIGKSRMLAEISARAARAGAQPLIGRAFDDQQTVPFGPLLSAVLNASPPIADPKALKDLTVKGDLGFWVVNELRTAISSAAARRPLVIALDDLHWADAGTLMAVRELVCELAQSPVMWALTTRPAEGRAAVRQAFDAIASAERPAMHRLRLGALAEDAVAELAADVLCANVDDSVLDLTRRTHGNPFLVLELLRGLRDENRIRVENAQASVDGAELPHRLTETMHQRLNRLSEDARNLVQVASVLPARFSVALLATMLGRNPAQLLSAVEDATRADLIAEDGDCFKFRHDLLRQAARQSIPYALRRAMERESAHVLLGQGAGPVEVAAQLARSADIGDAPAVTALRAASAALVQSDPSGAADLSLRAIELLRPEDEQRPVVVAETVERLNRATRYDEAKRLAASTVSDDIPEEAEALIRLSMSTVTTGYASTRVEQNRRALELQGVSDTTRARHLGYLAHHLVFEGHTQQAFDAAQVASEAADVAGDLYAQLLVEISLANVECSTGRGNSALVRVHSLLSNAGQADEKIAMLAICHCANLLMVLGHLDEGNGLCDSAIAAAQEHHYYDAVGVFTQLKAVGEFAAGHLSASRALVESVPEDQRFGTGNINSQIGSVTLAALAAHTEDQALQRAMAVQARRGLSEGIAERRAAVGMLSHMAWQRGDVAEAAQWLADDLDLMGTPPSPIHLDHTVIAARIVGSSGDAGLRERVLHTAARLNRDTAAVPVFAGVAAHVRGLLDHDIDVLKSAAQLLAGTGRPLLAAGAVEDVGLAMARHGMHDGAVAQLNTAFDTYTQYESPADCRRVARALAELGVTRRVVRARRKSGWESLTASELRVLDLVAEGATNREVAQQLSVSPNTVSTHLRKVFAKLGIHSRAELMTLANDARPSPGGAHN